MVEDSRVIDGQTYDFCIFGYSLTDTYDLDNGSNVYNDGSADYDPHELQPEDDGMCNFGCVGGKLFNPDWAVVLNPNGTIKGFTDENGTLRTIADAYIGEDIEPEDCVAVGNWDFGCVGGIDNLVAPNVSIGWTPTFIRVEFVNEDVSISGDYDFNKLSGNADDWFQIGTIYMLENTPLYVNWSSIKAEKICYGKYVVWDGRIVNGRIRMCQYEAYVNMPCGYSGWFETADLINLGKPSVNDYVSVTGNVYRQPDGNNGYAEKEDEKYYIVDILEDVQEGEGYRYAVGEYLLSTPIGYVSGESITILERNSSKRSSKKK